MNNQVRILSLLAAIFTIIGCGSAPEEKTAEKEPVVAEKVAITGDATKGKALFATCTTCHGQQAEGMLALGAPALANQESYYLKQQLQNFRTNKRGAHAEDAFGAQMIPFAKMLDSDGINDVTAYIKTLPTVSTEATLEGGNVEKGETYYNMICGACHGTGAIGIEALFSPRLVGTQDWYLERQINNFRNGIRGTSEGDAYGAQMQQIATAIPDDQTVKDVVAYINSLQAE